MTIIQKTILLFSFFFIYGCIPEGDPVGHWHITEDKNPNKRYWTVDIFNDSIAIAGINNIDGTSLGTHNFKEKEMIFLWECGSGVFKYKVRGDKMYLDQYELGGSFSGYRCNDDCCNKKEELLMDLKVDVELPEIHQQREKINFVELPRHLSLRIILGSPKKQYQETYGKELQMQLNDKLSPLEAIPFFIEEKRQSLPPEERKDINIEIIADKNVRLKEIQAIINELLKFETGNIWIAYFRENKETGSLLEFIYADAFDFNSDKSLEEYIPVTRDQ